MKAMDRYNPITVAIYFICVIALGAFSKNPIITSVSLLGALSLFVLRNNLKKQTLHLYLLAFFLFGTLINPLASHKGATVMFVINDSPITLEALIYGVFASAMICAVLYWFSVFSDIMTSDKLLYLFGKISPKLSLILSMSLRYVRLFRDKARRITENQKAMGLFKDDNIIDRIRGYLRVFSSLATWALENGITTADSMTARGYGSSSRRTHFSIFKFTSKDILLLCVTLSLSSVTLSSLLLGQLECSFYPTLEISSPTLLSYLGYVSYGVLTHLPTIIETEDNIKWKYLRSKI